MSDRVGQVTRRDMIRRAGGLAGAYALGGLLAACGGGTAATGGASAATSGKAASGTAGAAAASSAPRVGGSIIIGTLGEASSINPIYTTESEGTWRTMMMFDPVLARNPDNLSLVPNLATKWDIRPDGQQYTFTLRSDVKWQDGQPFTARDVEFTVLNILMPRYTGPYRTQFEIIQGADAVSSDAPGACAGIKVLGPQTIQFNLSAPNAPFLNNFYILRPLPTHLLQGKDPRTATAFNNHPIGTGAFAFKSWTVGGDFVAVANPNYWGGRPYLDQFTHRVIPDASTLVLALETREIDGSLYPDPTQYGNLRAKSFLNVYQQPYGSDIEGWGFSFDVPALRIRAVRQAIVHALDMREFLKIAYPNGLGAVANGPMNPNAWFWDKGIKPPVHDSNMAKQLLAKSGQQDVAVTLMVNNGNTQREALATYTQAQLKKIGIAATIQQPEWTTVVNTISTGKAQMSIPWGQGTYDPDDLYNYLYSTSPSNVYHYNNPQVDKLLTLGRQTIDQNKRIQIYDQMQQILATDFPTYWAYYRAFINVIAKDFGGVHPSFLGLFWNLPKIYKIA